MRFGLGLFKIQTTGVVGIELGEFATLCIALGEELIVVEGAIISWHAIEVAHVLGLGTFLVGEEGLVHFLAVADAPMTLMSSFLPPKSSHTASA